MWENQNAVIISGKSVVHIKLFHKIKREVKKMSEADLKKTKQVAEFRESKLNQSNRNNRCKNWGRKMHDAIVKREKNVDDSPTKKGN